MSAITTTNPQLPQPGVLSRQLGDTEVSYFLPSRESGVNDMYLHLGFRAPARLVQVERVVTVWAIMRLRHPLLASSVVMNDYNDIEFRYRVPPSPKDALENARQELEFRPHAKDELLDSYLNGPRTLHPDRLSYLIFGNADATSAAGGATSGETEYNYDILICAVHYLGDGMALHQFANDFFGILASPLDQDSLTKQLEDEWKQRGELSKGLPLPLEERLPKQPSGKFFQAASKIDFDLSQEKFIGGHAFPKKHGKERKTIVPTVSFDKEKTKVILKNCKAHGVSVSAALFAICAVAWSRTRREGWELPLMMYSALNLRSSLKIDPSIHDSYWFIAIGYFNVVLPSFLQQDIDVAKRVFWHRAQSAKIQSIQAAKTKLLIPRSAAMAKLRASRARVWAKEDDDKLRGIVNQAPLKNPAAPALESPLPKRAKAPSTALIGLSLLGNLDGMYKHANFAEIKMHTLTTGSRQRSGGMLLFGYTFVEKLWVSLGYDEAGFEEETVKRYWAHVLAAIDEFLVN